MDSDKIAGINVLVKCNVTRHFRNINHGLSASFWDMLGKQREKGQDFLNQAMCFNGNVIRP